MLHIIYSDGLNLQWHIGDSLSVDNEKQARVKSVIAIMIQADGDELDYIRENFSNIRFCKNRIVSWSGEDAKFIAANLNY